MSYEVSKKFWRMINTYPDYPHLLKRRFLDLVCILGNIKNAESILDIGCADCSMLILLQELTPIKRFYGIDISNTMMRTRPGLILQVADLTQEYNLPKTDVTTCFGMFPYIFEKEDMCNILKNIKSDLFLVRAPCTSHKIDEYINKFSVELNNEYSAIYRTVDSYKKIFSSVFNVIETLRAYPDEIEGNYGTKHYYFICRK